MNVEQCLIPSVEDTTAGFVVRYFATNAVAI